MRLHPLSTIEKSFWLNEVVHESHNNVSVAFRTSKSVDLSILEQALQLIVDESPLLRSRIKEHEGLPYWQTDERADKYPIACLEDTSTTADSIYSDTTASYIYVGSRFDLAKEYPCRFRLISRKNDNLLLFFFHHVVMDDSAMQLFTARLSFLYNELLEGRKPELRQSKVFERMEPVAEKDSESILVADKDTRSESVSAAADYWNAYVSEKPADDVHNYFPASLATETITPYEFRLDDIQPLLQSFCQTNNIGPFRLLAAAWGVTVIKALELQSVFINYPVSIRQKAMEGELFVSVNDLLLKVLTDESSTFAHILEKVTKDRREARQYQHAHVAETKVSTILHRPEGSIAFNYPLGLDNVCLRLNGEHCPLYRRTLNYMPSCLQLDVESQMSYGIVYTNEQFPAFFAQSLAEMLCCVLRQVVSNPDIRLSDIRLNDEGKGVRDEKTDNTYHKEIDSDADSSTLSERFHEIAQRNSMLPAVIFRNEQLTFAELDRHADLVAAAIKQKLSDITNTCQPKSQTSPAAFDFIGVYASRSKYTLALMLGVWKAGYAFIPLDPKYSAERLAYIVADSRMQLIVTDLEAIPVEGVEILPIRFEAEQKSSPNAEELHPSATIANTNSAPSRYAYMIYTSGTTGEPKGTPITQRSLMNLIAARQELYPLHPGDRQLWFGSISFDASIWDVYPALLSGATVCMAADEERNDPWQLISLMDEKQVNFALLPPTLLGYLPYRPLPALRVLFTGGDTCSAEIIHRWQQTCTVVNAYGPTENTVVTTIHEYPKMHDGRLDNTTTNTGRWNDCTTNIGRPLKNVTCHILDAQRHPVPFGVRGELYIGGAQLAEGYLNKPELTQEKFIDNPLTDKVAINEKYFVNNEKLYASGDLAFRLPSGDIVFCGRKDAQVKLRGFRIELTEIEHALLHHPSVRECVVVVQTTDDNHQLAAFVGTDSDELSIHELKAFIADKLPTYMIPSLWHVSTRLPLNTHGKVDRSLLSTLPLSAGDIMSIHDELSEDEMKLASILARILDQPVDSIGATSDFENDLALNSLAAIELTMQLVNRGITIHPSDIYRQHNIRKLAQLINEFKDQDKKPVTEMRDGHLCYMATPMDPRRPLLLIVCGYRYYEINYADLHNALKPYFNILVLESIIEQQSWLPETTCDAETLLDEYVRLLRPHIESCQLAAITGLCIGGDLALQLAVRLSDNRLGRPAVFNIDGMANRPHYQGQMGVMPGRGISSEEDARRRRFAIDFARTIPQHHYNGPFTLFLATEYEDIEDMTAEEARRFFPVNLANWEKAQPDANIVRIAHPHMALIHDGKALSTIVKEMRKVY